MPSARSAVRLVYLVAFARDYTPRSDAQHYQDIATAFANGDGIAAPFPFTYLHPTAFRPPLYPALLGAVYWITGVHVGVGQLVNVALGAAVVVLAAMLGAQIAGYRAGVAAGIAVGVYPPILANDVVLLSEPLSLVLLLGMILLLVRNRPTWAGAACGLLVLTRPSAQLLVIVVAAWLIWRAGWARGCSFRGGVDRRGRPVGGAQLGCRRDAHGRHVQRLQLRIGVLRRSTSDRRVRERSL